MKMEGMGLLIRSPESVTVVPDNKMQTQRKVTNAGIPMSFAGVIQRRPFYNHSKSFISPTLPCSPTPAYAWALLRPPWCAQRHRVDRSSQVVSRCAVVLWAWRIGFAVLDFIHLDLLSTSITLMTLR